MKEICTENIISVSIQSNNFPVAVAEMDNFEEYWWLARVFVKPDHRRKGLGKQLLTKIQELTKKPIIVYPGGYDIYFDEQIAFYKACGFQDTDEQGKLIFTKQP